MTIMQSTAVYSGASSGIVTSRNMEFPGSKERILISDNASAWSEEVKKRLEALVRLPVGWDGYQGTNVSFQNANFALRVLEAICGVETRTPQIVPGPAGDLQIEWHTLQGDLEIHVLGPNNVHVWRAMVGSNPEGEELVLKNDFAVVAQWVKEITESPFAAKAAA
jgi:hypothetical protein